MRFDGKGAGRATITIRDEQRGELLRTDLSDEGLGKYLKFSRGLSRGASARERDSVRAQFAFFKTMMEREIPAGRRKDVLARLAALEAGILG